LVILATRIHLVGEVVNTTSKLENPMLKEMKVLQIAGGDPQMWFQLA